MKNVTFTLKIVLFTLFAGIFLTECNSPQEIQIEWPEITAQNKPWTRWWWHGNAVNAKDLTAAMEEYQKAGLGGLEITPIYGVKGYEKQFINYLSPRWVDMLFYTLNEGKRLDLGIDMATGTGWPFGGSWVGTDDACKYMVYNKYTLKGGEQLNEEISYIQKPILRTVNSKVNFPELKDPVSKNPDLQTLAIDQVRFEKPLPLQLLMAYSDKGEIMELTQKVNANGELDWTAPEGEWQLYAVFAGWHGKMVERAGPGGEGNVIDHFSKTALENYLSKFDKALEGKDISAMRAYFNDSYEVDDARGQANFTPAIFDEFKNRRGYDLENHLPALFAGDTTEQNLRILCDYRQTISELLLEQFTDVWRKWANNQNTIIRNQAHGSPANILDLYAASDIPETEGTDLLKIKFASSAAHVSGKMLCASEAATWLNEHFLSTLSESKQNIDRYLLGGVNHVVYHGTPYSPQNEKWPGWMFYASVHYAPTNPLWKDFAAFNSYVARCQSFLQAGKPANDVLLYFPFFDRISVKGKEMLEHFSGGGARKAKPSDFRKLAQQMIDNGYSVDFISDKQIAGLKFSGDSLISANSSYKAVVIPDCRFLSLESLKKLTELANTGAKIIFHNKLPESIPGYGNLENRETEYKNLVANLSFTKTTESGISEAITGAGSVCIGYDISKTLAFKGISSEPMVKQGLHYIRRDLNDGMCYFVVNKSDNTIDSWIPVATKAQSVAIFNPANGEKGMAAFKDGHVYMQLQPGESCIIRTYTNKISAKAYPYYKKAGEPTKLSGEWTISFIKGGPKLPAEIKAENLKSWTTFSDDAKAFSGTAHYSLAFAKPDTDAEYFTLDLGEVHESALVKINNKEIGTLYTSPYRIVIPASLLKENNLLEIEVSNLMANRIADMDKKGINYKKFYNINFAASKRENRGEDGLFTATNWQPVKSGIIGKVTLTATKIKEVSEL